MALHKAEMEAAALKAAVFGMQGSGKSVLAAMLAVGLSLKYHKGAPIGMQDTEPGSDFLLPIFQTEGVELFVDKTRSFSSALNGLAESEKMGCCCFIEDSATHIWENLQDVYMHENKRKFLEFQDWKVLKGLWNDKWVAPMLASQLHVITCGRMALEYDSQEKLDGEGNPTGRKEIIQGDSKMAAEKGFGYEPSLLIEMIQRRVSDPGDVIVKGRNSKPVAKKIRSGVTGGHFVNEAHVLKDRSWRLNGMKLEFGGAIREYRKGDYLKVLNAFQPHLDFLNIGGQHKGLVAGVDTRAIVSNGDNSAEYYRMKRFKDMQIETLDTTLEKLWPGATAINKQCRGAVVETLFKVRSRTAVENLPLADLIWGSRVLFDVEKRIKAGASHPTEPEYAAIIVQESTESISIDFAQQDAVAMSQGRIDMKSASDVTPNSETIVAPPAYDEDKLF